MLNEKYLEDSSKCMRIPGYNDVPRTRNRLVLTGDYTGCLRNGVTEVLSNISLVFGARDLKLWINTVYYRTFDNQKMI